MSWLTKARQVLAKSIWQQGDWVGSDAPGNRYSNWYTGIGHFTGTYLNYESHVGPLYHNSAYMACLASYQDAFAQAPMCIKEMQADGNKTIIEHELTALFERFNEDEDGITTLDATLTDYIGQGDAYWLPVFDRAGNPRELFYLPTRSVRPITPKDKGRASRPEDPRVLEYEIEVDGKPVTVPKEDIIRIRLGMNPGYPQYGMGRGNWILRELFADNEATNYTGAILKNMGISPQIFFPQQPNSAMLQAGVSSSGFKPSEFVKLLQQTRTGDMRGNTVAYDAPLDHIELTNSPEKMALDVIRRYPESRVAAVLRVPAQVAGLIVGEDVKTYANYEEAREAFWQDSVLPMMRRIRSQITHQLIERNVKYQGKGLWFGFNYDEVPALQVDEQARDKNIRENFKYGLLDAAEARMQMGLDAKPEDEGRMYKPNAAAKDEEEEDPEERTLREMDEGRKAYVSPLQRLTDELAALDALNGHHADSE